MLLLSGCPKFFKDKDNDMLDYKLVPGGSEFGSGGTLCICRGLYKGNSIPGKYHEARKSCHFTWEGFEHSELRNFQVLRLSKSSNAKLQWEASSSSVPEKVVENGKTSEGEPLYVIRGSVSIPGPPEQTVWIPGRYQPSVGPYTGYGLKEIRCEENKWEFLTCI